MKSRIGDAVARREEKGYNCAQAVFCTYADLIGFDESDAYKIAEAFGTGMGGLQQTCGAVTAMFLTAGIKNADGVSGSKSTRPSTYAKVRELSAAFKAKNGSTLCKELSGANGGPRLRSCSGCVEDAARLIEENIFAGLFEKEKV